MKIDNIDGTSTFEKINNALKKMAKGIAVPMLILSILSTLTNFALVMLVGE